jgi:hypothetical protein
MTGVIYVSSRGFINKNISFYLGYDLKVLYVLLLVGTIQSDHVWFLMGDYAVPKLGII